MFLFWQAAPEDEETAVEGAIHRRSGWIACFPKSPLAGAVFGGGIDAVGAIAGNPALEKAYEIGKTVC